MLPAGVDQPVVRVGRLVRLRKVVVEEVEEVEVEVELALVEVEVVVVSGSVSEMVTVLVRRRLHEPKVVVVVAEVEQPDSTTLLMVVQDEEPGAVVVQETTKSVTVRVEQAAVEVVVESVTWQPRMFAQVEATFVVDGPIDDVVAHIVAVSVRHSLGRSEYVGL